MATAAVQELPRRAVEELCERSAPGVGRLADVPPSPDDPWRKEDAVGEEITVRLVMQFSEDFDSRKWWGSVLHVRNVIIRDGVLWFRSYITDKAHWSAYVALEEHEGLTWARVGTEAEEALLARLALSGCEAR